MTLSDLEKFYRERQSCREFSDMVVPEEVIREICRVALLAPSAMNAQPWKLLAVMGEKKDEAVIALQKMGMNQFAGKASALVFVTTGKGNFFTKVGSLFKENEFVKNDLGILTAHLTLAAQAAGVGSCILGWRDEAMISAFFGLDKDALIPEAVALGYPAEGYPVREKKRKKLDDVFELVK